MPSRHLRRNGLIDLSRCKTPIRLVCGVLRRCSTLLARSYSRYLCRKHGAATAEIIRLTREPLSPQLLNPNAIDPKNPAFEDLVASFGEVSK